MQSRWTWMCCALLAVAAATHAQLPDTKPVPAMQVLPLPYGQASFTWLGREITRYHFGPSLQRPFWYPMRLPGGRSLTRIGHPHDVHGHRHHDSVWITHMKIDGTSFWENDNGQRIICDKVHEYGDSDAAAWMVSENRWMAGDQLVLRELRRCEVRPTGDDHWLMIVDIEFKTPGDKPVTLDQSFFGLIGVRMAKTIGVRDGGGRILNAEGLINEKAVFRQPTRWVDYSGPIAPGEQGDIAAGITLMDHPSNPNFPAKFHVRNDGWMGVCTTGKEAIAVEPGKPRHFRYGLWVHPGAPDGEAINAMWKQFTEQPAALLTWK